MLKDLRVSKCEKERYIFHILSDFLDAKAGCFILDEIDNRVQQHLETALRGWIRLAERIDDGVGDIPSFVPCHPPITVHR